MKPYTTQFDLRAWRLRLDMTQSLAAENLGMSTAAYRNAEYESTDHGSVRTTVAKLAAFVETATLRSKRDA